MCNETNDNKPNSSIEMVRIENADDGVRMRWLLVIMI